MTYSGKLIFRSDITIIGKHAVYVTALVEDHKIFRRNIDVYMSAAIIGFINNKQGYVDYGEENQYAKVQRKIATEALVGEQEDLTTIFRTIIFLHNQLNVDVDERADLAFREDQKEELIEGTNETRPTKKHEENMALFHAYALGGIEILYEEIIRGAVEEIDYIANTLRYVRSFTQDFMLEESEEVVELLMKEL